MKTKNLKIARRALILAVALFGAASQGNEVEATCAFNADGVIFRCRGDEGTCHFDIGLDCDGSEVTRYVVPEDEIRN